MAAAHTITNTGSIISFNATSAVVGIPNGGGAQVPKYIRLVATAPCYVKLGTSAGTTAAAGDMMIQPADSMVVRSIGLTHVAAVQVSGPGVLQISPIEDN